MRFRVHKLRAEGFGVLDEFPHGHSLHAEAPILTARYEGNQ